MVVLWLDCQWMDVVGLADLGCVRVRPHFLWYSIPVNYLVFVLPFYSQGLVLAENIKPVRLMFVVVETIQLS